MWVDIGYYFFVGVIGIVCSSCMFRFSVVLVFRIVVGKGFLDLVVVVIC